MKQKTTLDKYFEQIPPPVRQIVNELWVTLLEQNTGESFDVGICPGDSWLPTIEIK